MIATISKAGLAACCLALCLGARAQSAPSSPPAARDAAQPTGTTGATAFQPGGPARAEAEAGSAQNGNAGMQERARPGFDNKPPSGAGAGCARPQGGVDASGGENIGSAAAKDNTACAGNGVNKAKKTGNK